MSYKEQVYCKKQVSFIKEEIDNFCNTRVYPKEFLLLFKNSNTLPEDFTLPDYGKPGFFVRKDTRKNPRIKHFKGNFKEKEKIVPLVKGENAWDPKKEIVTNNKTINGLLNKLTDNSFDKLSKKLIDILKENKELDKTVIELIYNKSIDELGFVELYVKLIKCLIVEFPDYKRLVILKCQTEFQNYKNYMWLNQDILNTVELTKLEIDSSENERLNFKIGKLKRKVLGNLHFIFVMYKHNIIQKNVIDQILNILLNEKRNETIEMLHKLITLLKGSFNLSNYKARLKLIKSDNIRLQSLIDLCVN